MLSHIRIVLVRPYHPGNIGAAARVMKNMGLEQLVLVNPVDFPSEQADKLAAGASDLLKNTRICNSLFEAISDCRMVIASSARRRGYDLPALDPQQCAHYLIRSGDQNTTGDAHIGEVSPAALVFGPERMGLSNEELTLARYRVTIPANPEYSSLNLASAVQILSYELFKLAYAEYGTRMMDSGEPPLNTGFVEENHSSLLPQTREMEQFYDELELALKETGFIVRQHPGEIMQKLRCLFAKAQPDQIEMNILRGMIASIRRMHR